MAVNLTDKNSSYLTCVKWELHFEIVRTDAVRTSYLWACIINGILAVHTTILNSLIILLYFKDRRLQTTANVLVLALAFTDLFIALLSQPVAIVNNALKLNGIDSCVLELLATALTETGVGLSCCTVFFIISLERLLAICWPLKHRVLVTKSRLKKIFLAEAVCCVLVLPVVLNGSIKSFITLQSGSIIFGLIFVLVVYVCIFATVHNRSKTIARNYLARGHLEKGHKNSVRQKIAEENVSQDSKRADEATHRVSQNSNLQHEPANNVFKDSKCKKTLHENMSQTSARNVLKDVSNDPKRTSQEIVSHDSNTDEMKFLNKKLKDKQCPFNACTRLQKAMSKLKQELRTCKVMSTIAGALLLCFVPRVVIFQCAISGAISMPTFYNYLAPWLDVLAYANSSLNPYIYFFHNKDMTEGAKKIVFGKNSARLSRAGVPPAP